MLTRSPLFIAVARIPFCGSNSVSTTVRASFFERSLRRASASTSSDLFMNASLQGAPCDRGVAGLHARTMPSVTALRREHRAEARDLPYYPARRPASCQGPAPDATYRSRPDPHQNYLPDHNLAGRVATAWTAPRDVCRLRRRCRCPVGEGYVFLDR